MRRFLVVGILLVVLFPATVRAGSSNESLIRFSHPLLSPGTAQIVTVVARDLGGRPLRRARVVLVVHLATRTAHIHMRPTNSRGMSSVVLHPSAALRGTRVSVDATISTSALLEPVSSSFRILGAPVSPVTETAAPTATATEHPARTATPVAAVTPSGGSIAVTAQAVPASATAPAPILVVVHVRSAGGQALPRIPIQSTAAFREGIIPTTGSTDSSGSATLRIDTAIARGDETVHVTVSATWKGQTAFSAADAALTVLATATPLPTATFLPTALPTNTPVPAPTDIPYPTNVPVPTNTPAPVYSPVPTDTPVPTATTSPTPVPTATLPTSCSGQSCMQALLALLNNTRAQNGLGPLSLDLTQSNGTASCVGSIGHSEAMEQSGAIWHYNASYPSASFPYNNCYYGGLSSPPVAQNVGMMGGSSEMSDLVQVHNLMMSEPYSPGCSGNHACTILSTTYHRVGLGILFVNGAVWVTEDFIG